MTDLETRYCVVPGVVIVVVQQSEPGCARRKAMEVHAVQSSGSNCHYHADTKDDR